MAARERMDRQLLRWMRFIGGDQHTASKIAVALGLGVDGVRKTLVRLHRNGAVRMTGRTGLAHTATWAVAGPPDGAARMREEEEIILTDEYDVMSGTRFSWHINAADRAMAIRELVRVAEVLRARAAERRVVAWPIGHQPFSVVIHDCEYLAGERQDARTSALLTEIAKLIESADARVQLRSQEVPGTATIPAALYFLSVLDDDLVTFVAERRAA